MMMPITYKENNAQITYVPELQGNVSRNPTITYQPATGYKTQDFPLGSGFLNAMEAIAKTFGIGIEKTLSRESQIPDKTLQDIHALLAWEADPYDSPAPTLDVIERAENWIKRLFSIAPSIWINPLVTLGSLGEVVFEWWNGARKLTVYVSDEDIEYIKVWGKNIHTEMDNGDATSREACKEIWNWLRDNT